MSFLPSLKRPRPRYSVRPFYATICVFSVIATISWAFQGNGFGEIRQSTTAGVLLTRSETEPECRLVSNVKDQCAYIRDHCPDHQDGLLSYLQLYYCTLAESKPVAFIILILWLSLLFSTIGIAASDFLCIDLSTLASILGLSESLTGVTFLAFGNGSPDVFSTFAAMRSNSGSLAIGELIGAATFITSVVAGSMALVRPFKVARRSFVRDVGFFVVAVAFSMYLLADGRLYMWESAAMVGLYAFYVVIVVGWHWYLVRRRRRYERDLAARTHFHIPNNQELDVEQPMDDDDPGVASDSRNLLRASTDNLDLLERAEGFPAWKEDDEEDDETRNRYLTEIQENMHIYRPTYRSRRNTMNPIRPSLVGALEFQSVLQSLQKSRNSSYRPDISLSSYSDEGDTSSRPFDTRSIASHPRASKPSSNDRLLPPSAAVSSRVRAVSANDAEGLRLDTSVLKRPDQSSQTPRLTVESPSDERDERDESQPKTPQLLRIDTNAILTASPASSSFPSPSISAIDPGTPQTPDLLAPPDVFNSPNYQAGATRNHSPLALSPLGHSMSPESPLAPFPAFTDIPSTSTTRAPSIRSIRLPNPLSPSDPLIIHEYFDDESNENTFFGKLLKRWWPYSILPPPQLLGCTLFPTLAGWKSKGIMGRFLGVIAAPSVFLLTITIPVIEPQGPESVDPDPVPSVIIEQFNDDGRHGPIMQLQNDTPHNNPHIHELDESTSTHSHKPTQHEPIPRPRWDSELPPLPSVQEPVPMVQMKNWNRWLLIIQLFTGPFFFVLIAWTTIDEDLDPSNLLIPSLISLIFSFMCLIALILSTSRRRPWHRQISHNQPRNSPEILQPVSLPDSWRPVLALLGFLVAISWIATIATEVVSLLKTLGVILNISDSLLGLTIFAVGNSLGDLVADITVARLGYPVMALSACFGGPMLNILLGIGLGGLYMTINGGKTRRHEIINSLKHKHTPVYEIAISKVLVISGATLLFVLVSLLIVVPLNKWRMDRRIGWGLIAVWCISTLGNVIAEVT
ncbi:Sodium/calcium exchanger membrane region [Penicillium taxi]|uniref:Sodium/calcium exchanger membrane region n=1 Tax=Penicillium taxi TaxID=168475 RepID=UPI0025450B7D|nr:Sodium/calcium exchanger membrane region [Penicillium taxi]KAJ5902369.1 Sodium/calcium exchanger membrane region [Penicillium taxi]